MEVRVLSQAPRGNLMFNIESIVLKWLKDNRTDILKNISDTIKDWLDKNKQEIYDIIKENSRNGIE